MGIFKLHIKQGMEESYDKPENVREVIFSDWKERERFIESKRFEAVYKKLEYVYKRGEYLRVYKGEITYFEMDIMKQRNKYVDRLYACSHNVNEYDKKIEARRIAERIFKPLTLS